MCIRDSTNSQVRGENLSPLASSFTDLTLITFNSATEFVFAWCGGFPVRA